MDNNHQPSHRPAVASAYYPSPPSHDENHSLSPSVPISRPQHMAVPYASVAPQPPMSMTPINGHAPVQQRHDMAPAPTPVMNGQPLMNGHVDKSAAAAKQNRLSKACDGCSVRKVKCDEEGPPCRACRSLQIPCTFNRPSRRRGPPNRHAEAIKKQKLELDATQTSDGQPQSATTNGYHQSPSAASSLSSPAALFQPQSNRAALTVEAICPMDLLVLFIDDFFTYMHPLYPFPHEPTFRSALLQERRDTHDSRFLALVASMIGCLVSTYPRQPLKRLKDTNRKHLFRSSQDLVIRCRDIALEARGCSIFSKSDLGVNDAATSFFLGQIATNSFTVSSGELYFGECFNILRALGYQRFHDEKGEHSPSAPAADPASIGQAPSTPQHINLIEREMAHRVYWSLYCLVRSAFTSGFGSGVADVAINPDTPLRRHPPLPLDIDDDHIYPDHVEPQPSGTPTPLYGLIHVCRMHLQYEPIKAFKLAWLVDEGYDKGKQNEIYRRCMENARSMFEDNLPPEFRIANSQPPSSSRPFDPHDILSPTVNSGPHFPSPTPSSNYSVSRRHIGLEIQKANIHTTFITTRAFYLEKYWGSNGHKTEVIGMTPVQVQDERLRNGQGLLDIMTQVRREWMEPCAFIFCMQVRQVTSTLYCSSQSSAARAGVEGVKEEDDDLKHGRDTAQAFVKEFLNVLVTLEKGGRRMSQDKGEGGSAGVDEGEELRLWAAKSPDNGNA